MLETIKSSYEISFLFSQGKRLHTPFITLIVSNKKQRGHGGRVAFIAGKKSGNAVWRNKAKRRMRSIYQEIPQELRDEWVEFDVIFLAKPGIMGVPYSKVLVSCVNILNRKDLSRIV